MEITNIYHNYNSAVNPVTQEVVPIESGSLIGSVNL
jgi:hypothetical protein